MNEILFRRYSKEVVKQGIPRVMAEEIVKLAIETGKGSKIDTYINYAIELTYGLKFIYKAK